MMMEMTRPILFGCFVVAAALLPRAGAGQNLSVVGIVRDTAGIPVARAEVTVMGRTVFSDSLGRFFVSHTLTDSIRMSVRRMGYESSSFTLSADDAEKNTVDVVLRRFATTLEAVNVEAMEVRSKTALRGFDERRERGIGVFVGRKEIEGHNTRLLSDVLRQKRGVVMNKGVLRFVAYQSRNCTPMLWLDGQQAPGMSLDAVSATDVEGVELYQSLSTLPPEFHRGNQQIECGTIVLWTKRPILEAKP
jgi:hypothetical protein